MSGSFNYFWNELSIFSQVVFTLKVENMIKELGKWWSHLPIFSYSKTYLIGFSSISHLPLLLISLVFGELVHFLLLTTFLTSSRSFLKKYSLIWIRCLMSHKSWKFVEWGLNFTSSWEFSIKMCKNILNYFLY